jgi:hypothetical protein
MAIVNALRLRRQPQSGDARRVVYAEAVGYEALFKRNIHDSSMTGV